jgi:hypothetical protein
MRAVSEIARIARIDRIAKIWGNLPQGRYKPGYCETRRRS